MTLYNVLSKSGVWNKTLLIITYDEHGGCYDHLVPPSAVKPDSSEAQFQVGKLKPFEQYGPRVPAGRSHRTLKKEQYLGLHRS